MTLDSNFSALSLYPAHLKELLRNQLQFHSLFLKAEQDIEGFHFYFSPIHLFFISIQRVKYSIQFSKTIDNWHASLLLWLRLMNISMKLSFIEILRSRGCLGSGLAFCFRCFSWIMLIKYPECANNYLIKGHAWLDFFNCIVFFR